MKTNWTEDEIGPQTGKCFLITGASSGVGLAAARSLIKKGGAVIMAIRNIEKGEQIRRQLLKEVPKADIELMPLDLSDLNSVTDFVTACSRKYQQLDVLINNAGILLPDRREETAQGFESHFGTNHLGHFVLTAGLFETLKNTKESRIVTVASLNPKFYKSQINWEDLQFKKRYNGTAAYTQSKLANIMFALELDHKLKAIKSPVKSVVTNPGFTRSGMQKDLGVLARIMALVIAQGPDMGKLPQLRAAVDKDVHGGEFFSPNKMKEMRGYPELITPPAPALDHIQRDRLWELSKVLSDTAFNL
jgi:NAD(P)-dependent dehydrogenase (short-subunit alcohol dehydrogenase family)